MAGIAAVQITKRQLSRCGMPGIEFTVVKIVRISHHGFPTAKSISRRPLERAETPFITLPIKPFKRRFSKRVLFPISQIPAMHKKNVIVLRWNRRIVRIRCSNQACYRRGWRIWIIPHRPAFVHFLHVLQFQVKWRTLRQFRHPVAFINGNHQLAAAAANGVKKQMRHRMLVGKVFPKAWGEDKWIVLGQYIAMCPLNQMRTISWRPVVQRWCCPSSKGLRRWSQPLEKTAFAGHPPHLSIPTPTTMSHFAIRL